MIVHWGWYVALAIAIALLILGAVMESTLLLILSILTGFVAGAFVRIKEGK